MADAGTDNKIKKNGRPRKKIDYDMVDRLCEIQCTGEEIASVLAINYDTLCAAIKRDKKLTFSDYYEEKRAAGKCSLRRMQWKGAEAGNVTMLIWLGKQYLGQRDKSELSGQDGKDFEIKIIEV